jgi:hypothetical protein
MVRQERFGGGMADQKNLDAQFAKAIMGDGKFQVRGALTTELLPDSSDVHRTILTTWTIMQNDLDGRRCGPTQ